MESGTVRQTNHETDEQFQYTKGVIESLLFVNERPVTLEQIKKVLDTVSSSEIKKAILDLQNDYEERKSGMMVLEIAGGYQMLSNPAYASYLRSFYKTKHKEKLSKPALESMAIIAYKQPVTRSDIELIRGVNSDGVVANLLDKELIKVVGRKDVPGRPYVYGTTKQFLEYFGLKSLDDLPALKEFPALQPPEESIITEQASGEQQEESESPLETRDHNNGDMDKQEGLTVSESAVKEIGERTEEKGVHDEPEKSA